MHKFAQHFLINEHAIQRIIDSLELNPTDTVLEIGPGKGALTTYLVRRAKQVIAIEVDEQMIGILKNKLGAAQNFQLIESDVMDIDLDILLPSSRSHLPLKISSSPLEGGGQEGSVKVVGNLPYNLTSPILRKLCDWTGWSSAVLMVQKEVGERLCAKPGTSEYGALTVGVSLTCSCSPVFVLSETSFKPPPRVKSMVVRLDRRPQPLTEDIPFATKVIQAAFQQRRKTILNSLSHGLSLTKEEIGLFLEELKIEPTQRAETISIDQYVHLSHLLKLKTNA